MRSIVRSWLFLLLVGPLWLPAQDGSSESNKQWDWSHPTIVAEYHRGTILPVEAFLRGENLLDRPMDRFQGFSLRYMTRASGDQLWHHRHRLPESGFGLTLLDYDNPLEVGRPVAIHRSFRAPLRQWNRLRFDYGADIGLATGWKTYDTHSNPYNKLISTRLTAYFRLGMGARFQLADHWAVSMDAGLTHVSNGNLKRPNAGLNAASVGLGLQYTVRPTTAPVYSAALPRFAPVTDFTLSAFGGVEKRLYRTEELPPEEKYRGLTHGLGGVSAILSRRLTYASKLGIGGSVLYHGGDNLSVWTDAGQLHHENGRAFAGPVRVGFFPAYELIFNRWSVQVQAEYYLLAAGGITKQDRFRQRIGLKYHLTDRTYLAMLVNARQFSIADFVEWHVGYSFTRNQPRRGSD